MTNYKDAKYQIPASGIISGTLADARISESSVSAHVNLTPVRQDVLTLGLKQAVQENSAKFNLPNSAICKFEADADFNLAGSTDVSRSAAEYISSASGTLYGVDSNTKLLIQSVGQSNGSTTFTDTTGNHVVTAGGAVAHETMAGPFATNNPATSIRLDSASNSEYLALPVHEDFSLPKTSSWTLDWWMYWLGQDAPWYERIFENTGGPWTMTFADSGTQRFSMRTSPSWYDAPLSATMPTGAWHHWAVVHNFEGNTWKLYKDGTSQDDEVTSDINWTTTATAYGMRVGQYQSASGYTPNSWMHDIRISKGVARTVDSTDPLYISSGSTFSVPTKPYSGLTISATGTALGTTNVPTSAVTKVSGVMLLKNNAGTNTLGTDVKVYFTANNSAFTECTYADAGTFSTGVKMIKLGNTTCTSGSDVRWKIVWANQAAAKEAHIYGIGLNY